MACCSSSLTEEQLLCSICLDVFKQPVSLPCGHNFCKTCIKDYWDPSPIHRCPLCMRVFSKRKAKLNINHTLRELADHFKSFRDAEKEMLSVEEFVACDVCTGTTKVKASKSCLECLTSYCQAHLEPHQRVAGLKRHTLIHPVGTLEYRVCKQHGQLLDQFCRTDQTCVCQFCMDCHKTHEMVSLGTEYKEKMFQLRTEVFKLEITAQQKESKVKEINISVQQGVREVADGIKILTDLKASLERSLVECNRAVSEGQNWAKEAVRGLEQELQQLTQRRTELERLLRAEDHLHLLQNFLPLSSPPHGEDCSGTNADCWERNTREALKSSVTQMVAGARRSLSELVVIFDKETAEELPDEECSKPKPRTSFPSCTVSLTERRYKAWEVKLICFCVLVPCCLVSMLLPFGIAGVIVPALAIWILKYFLLK